MLVCPDANIYRAVSGAIWGGLSNAGQSCAGVERVYVHEAVYDEFLRLLKEKVEKLRVRNGMDWESDMGVMTTKEQIETVNAHIADALAKGAKIYAQSPAPEDGSLRNSIPATVLTDVNHTMLVMKEETFGPVLGVMKVDSMEEAVGLANDSQLGLTGSVWSKNHAKAIEIGKQMKAGAITINDHLMSHGLAETPWGGFKESGIGRTHGRLGFDEMTQPQVIVNDILPFVKRNMWWGPYSQKLYNGLRGLIEFLYAGKPGKRLSGLMRTLRIVPRYFTRE
jgi:succinate-semialdehyde dehydrogenase/glutarate-semialdehyde dehydrogenase